jgi:HAD superfamily hydrolase (TIGR01509 family)
MKALIALIICHSGVATLNAFTAYRYNRSQVCICNESQRKCQRKVHPKCYKSTRLNENNQDLEAILWDMDGVLADTERDGHRPAFNQAFIEYNLDATWDVDRYGKLLEIGGGKERMTAYWNEIGWPETIPTEQQQDIVKTLHLRKTDIFMEMINQGTIPLRPGVLRIIDDAIAANIKLAVCSTSNVLAVTNLVRTLIGPERAKQFTIFAGDMVKKKKPAPDVYNMAVQEMELDKSRCVIVEDSHIGLGAAKAAGIACIVTKSYYTANEDFTGASMIVDELGDDPITGVTLETLAKILTIS